MIAIRSHLAIVSFTYAGHENPGKKPAFLRGRFAMLVNPMAGHRKRQ